jgi:hypothetical protein
MSEFASVLEGIELNEDRFLGLLSNLIGVAKGLQNNPAQGENPSRRVFNFCNKFCRVDSQRGFGI